MNNETEQIFIVNTSDTLTAEPKMIEPVVTIQGNADFSTVCRTCATVTEFVIPIFDGEGLQNNLADKIHKHLPIQVSESDVLPLAVCYQCASTLLAWHELVQCCVQADAALRARLQPGADPAESKLNSINVIQNSEQEQQPKRDDDGPPGKQDIEINVRIEESEARASADSNKPREVTTTADGKRFKEIADFVEGAAPPPAYAPPSPPPPAPGPPPPPAPRDCPYCARRLPARAYRDHLLAAHSDHLFHCDECGSYVDRKEFVAHMSQHAVEYAAEQDDKPERRQPARKATKTEKIDKNENDDGRKCSRRTNKNRDRPQSDGGDGPNAGSDREENEFSDRSDSEDGFGSLPESVFEAIEDSQDGQPARAAVARAPDTGAPGRSDGAEGAPPPPPPGEKTGPEKKSRTCPICGKVYRASSSYFYHMKHFHGGRREHGCGACGKRFGTRGALAAHEPVHTGARAFGCERCGKRFLSKAGLYIHAQTHGAARRWACGSCPRAFRWRAQLARHAARHGAERAHACATCARGFSVRADLLRHARTHARGDHACLACGLRFAQRRYLKVHMDRKHPPAPADAEPAPPDVD